MIGAKREREEFWLRGKRGKRGKEEKREKRSKKFENYGKETLAAGSNYYYFYFLNQQQCKQNLTLGMCFWQLLY